MKIRWLVRNDGDLYVAMTLDFGLAAQGYSLASAKDKLFQQIEEYIREAYEQDSEHKEALLSRKGPFSSFMMYYLGELLHVKDKGILEFADGIKSNYVRHA